MSKRTGSGAEDFAYNLKNLNRATLLGENTWGGANPGGTVRLNAHFSVCIPVGKAINPVQVEGQIEGAVAQSVGWAMLENYVQRDGHAVTKQLSTYLIPGVLDVAHVEPVILELPDPQGPFGLRGMAEMPFIPTAPAIAAAIHDAIGVWLDELPYTPERVWMALQRDSAGKQRR